MKMLHQRQLAMAGKFVLRACVPLLPFGFRQEHTNSAQKQNGLFKVLGSRSKYFAMAMLRAGPSACLNLSHRNVASHCAW
mmetsp:Transcript_14071/g.35556  ORF Transcript_14071/g.35556 Transcript_14071/m.35556 type:complete len:80 (-) Transcript_14071:257-496(-)